MALETALNHLRLGAHMTPIEFIDFAILRNWRGLWSVAAGRDAPAGFGLGLGWTDGVLGSGGWRLGGR